jgi:hypothetical protein
MSPLFPPDWREQVRAYLAPFQVECSPPSDEEQRGEVRCYRFEVIELTENLREEEWDVFRLGNATVHYLGTPQYGGEEWQCVMWAKQSDFEVPLHFWAAAATVFTYPQFDFRVVPHAQSSAVPLKPTIKQILLSYGWPLHKVAIPPILDELVVSSWQLNGEWNDHWALYITESLFCLGNWGTAA